MSAYYVLLNRTLLFYFFLYWWIATINTHLISTVCTFAKSVSDKISHKLYKMFISRKNKTNYYVVWFMAKVPKQWSEKTQIWGWKPFIAIGSWIKICSFKIIVHFFFLPIQSSFRKIVKIKWHKAWQFVRKIQEKMSKLTDCLINEAMCCWKARLNALILRKTDWKIFLRNDESKVCKDQ